MVVANLTAALDADAPSPSHTSLSGLDAVNLFLAGALSGFGPYVAVFLAEQKWTEQKIGFVLTAAGFIGLLSQLPGGVLLDNIRSKRTAVALGASMVAVGALIIVLWPSFPLVLAALSLQAITGGFLGPAIAAISLGLVGHSALGERLGRNQRFASTGGLVAAGLMGLIGYYVSYRAIFIAAAALVLPLLFALGRIRSADIHFGRACGNPDHRGSIAPPRAWYLSLFKNRVLLTFAGCVFLFQLANASMPPLAGEALVYRKAPLSSLIVSALIIVPRGIVALMAQWAGRRAKTWGRRPLLLCRVLRFACPPAVVFLDHQSNNSHCRSDPRWDKWNVTRRARGTNHCRPDNSGRFNFGQGLVGTVVRRWRFAQHDTFKSCGREARYGGGISRHRSSGARRRAAGVVAYA